MAYCKARSESLRKIVVFSHFYKRQGGLREVAYLSPDHYNEKEQPKSVKDLKFAVPKRRGLGSQTVVHLTICIVIIE